MPDSTYKDFVLDQLRCLDDVVCRPMFGAFGLYHAGVFFGIIHGGGLYFKTDEVTREAYSARGMEPLRATKQQVLTSYYQVPEEVIDDPEWLARWATEAASLD